MYCSPNIVRVVKYRRLRWVGHVARVENGKKENGEWRNLHIEELHILYRSLNLVWVIKSRRLRWAGHIVRWKKLGE